MVFVIIGFYFQLWIFSHVLSYFLVHKNWARTKTVVNVMNIMRTYKWTNCYFKVEGPVLSNFVKMISRYLTNLVWLAATALFFIFRSIIMIHLNSIWWHDVIGSIIMEQIEKPHWQKKFQLVVLLSSEIRKVVCLIFFPLWSIEIGNKNSPPIYLNNRLFILC